MKKIFKIFLLAGLVPLSLTSCLKDETVIDLYKLDKTENVIEFANTSAIASPATSSSQIAAFVNIFDLAPENEFNITVSYLGAHTAPQDITVQLAVDLL